ncbi:MAG: hypothetical protein RLZZ77_2042 [Bacteroidota bacterium]
MRQWILLGLMMISFLSWGKEYPLIENRGQWPQHVKASTAIEGGRVFLENNGLTYHFFDLSAISAVKNGKAPMPQASDVRVKGHVLRMSFLNSAARTQVIKEKMLPTRYNYFLGDDESKWAGACAAYETVTTQEVWPGVDFKLYSNDFFLKYDFVLAPFADFKKIAFRYEYADAVSLENGRLKITTSVGEIWEQQPIAYQYINGEQVRVACEFVLKKGVISFHFPKGYEATYPLIIDPELVFSTYSGSFSDNFGYTATYDSQGFLFSGSSAFGQGYPTTTGAYQTTWGGGDGSFGLAGTDIAISKYDVSGTFMVWSTFLGGENDELPHSLICNEFDELLVYGTSSSANYPTTSGAYDSSFNGGDAFSPQGVGTNYVNGSDIVVTRLNFTGSNLIQSTFIGGNGNDGVNTAPVLKFNYADEFRGEIDIDDNGNIVIASSTYSTNFPTVNPVQGILAGAQDGVVFILNAQLNQMLWSTYIGGSDYDSGYSVCFGNNGEVYVGGGTRSTDFPMPAGGYQSAFQGGTADGWIHRYTATGELNGGTFYGSSVYDQVYFVETDAGGHVYLYGQTLAPDATFVTNAAWSQPNSGMVVSKLSANLQQVDWSTVFGSGNGEPNLSPTAFLVDLCDKIYLSGWGGLVNTSSNASTDDTNGMLVTTGAYQTTTDGSDFYLLVLLDDASDVAYASFYGGNISAEHVDGGTSRFDRRGMIYQSVCAGCGSNDDFPIFPANANSPTNNSTNCNNGVFKFDFEYPITVAEFNVPPVACVNEPVQFTSNAAFAVGYNWNFGDNSPFSTQINPTHIYTNTGTYEIQLIVTNPGTCNVADTLTRIITITEPQVITLDDEYVCVDDQLVIGPTDVYPDFVYNWTPAIYLSNSNTANPTFTAGESTEYVLTVQQGGCTDTLYLSIIVPELSLTIPNDTTLCEEGTLVLVANYAPNDASIEWSNTNTFANLLNDNLSDADIEINVSAPGEYFARVSQGDCSLEESITVNLLSFQTEIEGDFTACAGDTVTLSVLDPNPNFEYSWEPSNLVVSGQNTPEVQVVANEEGYFYVYSFTPDNCTAVDSVLITVSGLSGGLLNATASPSLIIAGGTSQLQAQPSGYTYSWSPANSLSNPNIINPIAQPDETTTYTVTVMDGECMFAQNVTVRVEDFVCGNPTIYIPNAFTPNVDGKNEKLYVRGNNLISLNFYVYDRWGELVFESHSVNDGWDGTFEGRPVDPDVYVYYFDGVCEGGAKYIEKGNITLIR